MKTPREVLLARHKAVEPKLDEIRCRALAESFGLRRETERHAALAPGAQTPKTVAPLRFATAVQILWRELIWPCRRTWAGLVAAWLAILTFNHSQSESGPTVVARATVPPAEIRLAFREQHRVLEEILGAKVSVTPAEPSRRLNNQPRSERRALGMA